MYKILIPVFILIAVVTISSSCNKNFDSKCPVVNVTVPDTQITALNRYTDTSNITNLVKDPRGFSYSILDTGIGTAPTACNVITVSYSGILTDGTIFDSGHNVQLTLNTLILGWQVGIPLIRTGGVIKLYLPPALAYGTTGTTSIPANSILVFTIELDKVQ